MSNPKITPKNLSYDKTLPPFLAALHGQTARGPHDGPDPILAGRRRPAKPRSGSAEAEDAPQIVDDEGNEVLDVTVGVDGAVTELKKEAAAAAGEEDGGATAGQTEGREAGEKIAGIGAARKRKVGKVIGAGDEDDEGDDGAKRSLSKEAKKGKAGSPGGDKTSKGKKKAKKVKLSFRDGDGD